jgi:hypothetical protein
MQKIIFSDEHFINNPRALSALLFFPDVFDYAHEDFSTSSVIVEKGEVKLLHEEDIVNYNCQIYIVLDTTASENFGHFFYENLIYLQRIKYFLEKYPNTIFLVKQDKNFKSKIFNHYGMRYSTSISEKKNLVGFFPLITSLHTNKSTRLYSDLLFKFHCELSTEKLYSSRKDLNIVYFPRHKSIDNTPSLERTLEADEIEGFVKNQNNSVVFDSENNDVWDMEVDVVRRCRILIVPDGSSACVLGFYAKDTIIIVLGSSYISPSTIRFEKCKEYYEIIKKNNEIYFIRGHENKFYLNDILPILDRRIICT